MKLASSVLLLAALSAIAALDAPVSRDRRQQTRIKSRHRPRMMASLAPEYRCGQRRRTCLRWLRLERTPTILAQKKDRDQPQRMSKHQRLNRRRTRPKHQG